MKKKTKETIKNIIGMTLPPVIRYGPHFKEFSRFLAESQFWNYEKLKEYQNIQLSKLVNHAYTHTVYYRKIFDDEGLEPTDIKTIDDITKIPFLDKKLMKDNLENMRSDAFKEKDLTMGFTGGSTGIPVGFYREKERYAPIEKAFILREREWAGIKYRDRLASFAGSVVVKDNRGRSGRQSV